MFSIRSWYFVLSSLLVRCMAQSATLESGEFKNLGQISRESEAASAATSHRNLIGIVQLYRRVQEHSDAKISGIILAVVIWILILASLTLVVCVFIRRRRIMDVENRVVDVKKEVVSPAGVQATFWQRARSLWHSTTRRKALEQSSHADPEKRASLPFADIPPLQKPAAVLDQQTLRPETSPRDNRILLPFSGGLLSVSPSGLADVNAANAQGGRRRAQVRPASALYSPESFVIDKSVAQTIIAKTNKPKIRDGSPVSPSRPRKGSLLSGPPLTAPQQSPTFPSEEDLVDIGGYRSSAPSLEPGRLGNRSQTSIS